MSTYTLDQYEALRDAYARGALRVRMNGEEVEFASGEEMRRRLGEMARDLGLVASPANGGPAAFANPTFHRGF